MNRTALELLLAAALPAHIAKHPGGAGGPWRFCVDAGGDARGVLRVDGHWVVLEDGLAHPADPHPLMRASAQAAWAGGVKFADIGVRGPALLRAEVPLLTGTQPGREWMVRQLHQVIEGFRGAGGRHGPASLTAPATIADCDPGTVAEQCGSLGWRASVKPDGEVWVSVESRAMPRTVVVARDGRGLRAAVTFAFRDPGRADPCTPRAVGLFLLRATGALRWVRAFATADRGVPCAVGFECLLADGGGDLPLAAAIDCLTTACELFGCEVEALLAIPALARAYLGSCAEASGHAGDTASSHRLPEVRGDPAAAIPEAAVA